jgi:hypothetical protein
VLIDWTSEFNGWLDKLEAAAANGDALAQRKLDYVAAGLQVLKELDGAPDHESATLMRVRQRRNYPIWRVSHPYDSEVAMRLIVWFPDDETAVIVAFAGDKARIGDAFYLSTGSRADAAIDQWKREVARENEG